MTNQNDSSITANHGETDNSLLEDIGSALRDTSDYTTSKLSLAATEAKVAASSIVMMLVLAFFAVIVLCGTWALVCYALAQWLVLSFHVSAINSALILALCNLVVLVFALLAIKSLSNAIRFSKTLSE